jgi:hypothetical protein
MSAKKLLKAKKSTEADKAIKAKRTGYRFKTEGNPKLHKKDGDLNAKGKELYYKKPTPKEIEEFKRDKDGNFADDVKQIYHERRADRKHSDDNLVKKYEEGGSPNTGLSWKLDRAKHNKSEDWEKPMKDRKKKFKTGGKVKQGAAQSESYSPKKDKKEKAKPVGKRFTNELAEELGKSKNATPTKAEVKEYLGNGVYDEKRKDKSDVSLTKKYEEGGEAKEIEMSVEEMKVILGREPKYPNDFINGKKYQKCFLRPYYKLID